MSKKITFAYNLKKTLMGKVLVVGAGGVGTVAVTKMAQLPDLFTEIMLASRTKSKCDAMRIFFFA